MNLIRELADLVARFDTEGVSYALCGGLAMAIHATPRATIDIDVLVLERDLERAKESARREGYHIEAKPMVFAGGKVPIHRLSKPVPGEQLLSLDLIVVTAATQAAWDTREKVQWREGTLWVVSRSGLIALKTLRGSGQDQDDIKRLEDR